jgi:dTDP-glucose 4,6-dehydratase
MEKSTELIEFVEDRPGHDFRYSLNSSKIKKQLGWSVKTDFEKGLEKTIEWYLSHPDWWKNLSKKILNATPWKN